MLHLPDRLLGAALAAAGLALAALAAPGHAAVERLVMAVNPPAGDTNLFSGGSGDVSLQLAMGRLVGNDPETGDYSTDGLAERWEHNDDFTQWTFHLKRGVPFHGGWGEVSAHDVALSYELNTGPDSQHAGVARLRGATVDILGDHTIRFTFPEPRQGLLFSLASRGALVVYSKAQHEAEGLEGFLRSPAGTEHFRLVERRTGEAHIADLPPELMPQAVAAGKRLVASLNPSMHVTGVFNGLYMQSGDPERAKALLAEAGYPDAFAQPVIPIIHTVLGGNPEFGVLAELLQVSFEAIGLQTEMREMDWASLRALGQGRRSYVIHPVRNAPIRPTEIFFQDAYTVTGSPFEGWEDDHMQALIDRFFASLDPAERDAIGREAFTYVFEQYSDMPIAAVRTVMAVNPEVVADWRFPGVTSNGISHWHLIQPAN